jgi:ADP-ribosyl-[dinitrogen reductase] hydrolase
MRARVSSARPIPARRSPCTRRTGRRSPTRRSTLGDRYRGCLLGGAIGDALGAGIEFLSLSGIRRRYGPVGVTGYVPAYGRLGAITDDTQMTLFTAEGLLRNQQLPSEERDACAAIWRAYGRWLSTQEDGPNWPCQAGGWLISQGFLHAKRAPGTTCLGALWAGQPGSLLQHVNNSKGCGGVMRVAPLGLTEADSFALGCQAAALTHGHPSGYYSAGALAVMIHELVHGADLRAAVASALDTLHHVTAASESAEVISSLEQAAALAGLGPASPTLLATLGAGWVGEEALAIAIYCALTAADFRSGVLAAVNHSGDSDSTGALCGNLLGARLGATDTDLLDGLEGGETITQVADDLYEVFAEGQAPSAQRYPPG